MRTWAEAGFCCRNSAKPGGPYPSRTERGPHTLRTRAGAGPTTELSSRNVADLEPDGPRPSRTEREPTRPTRCGPAGERAGQAESESDEAGAHKHHRWPRPEPDPRLSYQARTWLIRSRTGFIRVGRSGSRQKAPHAADLGRSRTHKPWLIRSRTGQVRVGWSGSPTRCEPGQEPSPTWAGAERPKVTSIPV